MKARQAGASHGYQWHVTVLKVTPRQAKRLLSTKKAFLISIRRTAITKVLLPLAISPLLSNDWPHSRPQGVTPRTHASYPPLLPAPLPPSRLIRPLFLQLFFSYNDEKMRIPAWCDRVLWRTWEHVAIEPKFFTFVPKTPFILMLRMTPFVQLC